MSYSLAGDPGGSSVLSQHQHYAAASPSQAQSGTLLLAPIPEGVIGLVRDGGVPQSNLPLPEAIVQVDNISPLDCYTTPLNPSQITQPLSRAALSEGGVTALVSRAGQAQVTVTPVTLRSGPVSVPSRHSTSSDLLEEDIGAGDYITLTSTNPALVFSSHQDRGGSSSSSPSEKLSFLSSLAEVPLDSITLDTDRGLAEEGSSLSTANTRVLLSSQPQARGSSQPQTLVTGMVFNSPTALLQDCRTYLSILVFKQN